MKQTVRRFPTGVSRPAHLAEVKIERFTYQRRDIGKDIANHFKQNTSSAPG
jgi:hypothetical protein